MPLPGSASTATPAVTPSSKQVLTSPSTARTSATAVSFLTLLVPDLPADHLVLPLPAWYEWFPAGAYDFSGITFKAGDTVTMTVTAFSKTSGKAWIRNHRTGKVVSHAFSGQPALCEYDAEWIVEDFSSGGLVPFANFGKVTFTDATATTTGNKKVGPKNAKQIDIIKSNKVITKVATGDKSVTVTYTGQ